MNFIFHFIYGIILPIDELIFFKMVKTTNQIITHSSKYLKRRLCKRRAASQMLVKNGKSQIFFMDITDHPLVNIQKMMERSTIFHGQINYFDWAIFNRKLFVFSWISPTIGWNWMIYPLMGVFRLTHWYPLIPIVSIRYIWDGWPSHLGNL